MRASRGYVQGWYSKEEPTMDKPSLATVLEEYRNEPTVQAAVRAIADEVIKNGYSITSDNKQLKTRIERELKTKYRFNRLLRRIVYNLIIYGNVFVELVYAGNTVKEMHLLETSEMNIISSEHGEVIGYRQIHGTMPPVEFTTDEVVHISLNNITSALWGEVDLQALYKTVAMKQYIENFIINLFRYNKFRDSWSIKNADKNQIKDFINNLRLAQDMPEKELVIDGEISKINGREISDLNELVELLNYTRQQILTLLRVPPIIAGIPDNSNRSNSEVQSRKSFDTRIKSIQEVLAEELNFELFELMGWERAEFKFNPIDKRAEKDDIEIIVALKNIGLDDKSVLQYIKDVGIQIRDGATIKKQEQLPSINKQDEVKDNKDEGMPKHETGEESTTRDDQLGRSRDYIEPLDQFEEEVLNGKY